MKFVIKESRIAGKGSFATEDIQIGESIVFFEGEVVSRAELNYRIAKGVVSADDDIQIDEHSFLDISKTCPAYFFNHNCNPNAGIRGKKELFALQIIKEGEEITLDYSTSYSGEHDEENIWSMQCSCGAENCRRNIGGVETIPQEILKEYSRLGALPDFLIKKMKLK